MKNIIKHFGIIALVAIIGFTMIACDSGGSGSKKKGTVETVTYKADPKPNLTVTKDPNQIPDFDSDYTAMSKQQAEAIVDELVAEYEEMLNDLLGQGLDGLFSKSSNYGRAAFGRAGINLSAGLSDLLKEEGIELPSGTTLVGNIVGKVSFPDNGDFPMSADGTGEFRLEANEPIDTEDGSLVMGFVTGSASVNNVRINSEDSMSGSASGTVNYALNFADIKSMEWVKLIGDIKLSTNLGNQTASFTAKFDAFGDGTKALATKTITVDVNAKTEKATVTVK